MSGKENSSELEVTKAAANLILDLPRSFMASVLTEWQCIEELCMLDTAFCSKIRREEFLAMYDSDSFVVLDAPFFNSEVIIEWLVLKKIRIRHIDIPATICTMDAATRRAFFMQTGQFIVRINCHNCRGDTSSFLGEVAKYCPNVLKFYATNCELDKSLRHVLNTCKQIEQLRLDRCIGITKQYFKDLDCPAMKIILLPDIVTDDIIIEMAKSFKNVIKLDIHSSFKLTNKGLNAVAKHCSKLQAIGLFLSSLITDASIVKLAQSCTALTILDICYCTKISDKAFVEITTSCKHLQKLFMHGNSAINDSTMLALAQGVCPLTLLYMMECPNITDVGMNALASACAQPDSILQKSLKSIYLSSNDNVTADAINNLIMKCKGLIEISLCTMDIDDLTLNLIANNSPGLQRLNLLYSTGFTEKGVFYLANHCTELRLFIVDNPVVTALACALWKRFSPNLTFSSDRSSLAYSILT